MPSTSVFDRQDRGLQDSVLPPGLPRVAVEAGVTPLLAQVRRLEGEVVGIDRFGESAPAGELFKHFGFTAENVAKAVRSVRIIEGDQKSRLPSTVTAASAA
jgi:transketolase